MTINVPTLMGMGIEGGEAHGIVAELGAAKNDAERTTVLAKHGLEYVAEHSTAHFNNRWHTTSVLRRRAT